jgi:hypothetical protein
MLALPMAAMTLLLNRELGMAVRARAPRGVLVMALTRSACAGAAGACERVLRSHLRHLRP